MDNTQPPCKQDGGWNGYAEERAAALATVARALFTFAAVMIRSSRVAAISPSAAFRIE
ncbi:MAG: hypothetical protein ABSH32_31055 [Bryobacteraceae bacterium]